MLEIGTKIKFTGVREPYLGLPDVTFGNVYVIEGIEEDEEEYFIDDVGEKNFAASSLGGDGIYEVVEEQ